MGATGLLMLAGAAPALATGEAKSFLELVPNKVKTDQPIQVTGACSDGSTPPVTSPGFREPAKFGEWARAGLHYGNYTATAKCANGQVLTAGFVVVDGGEIAVQPRNVHPGGDITVKVWCPPGTGEEFAHSPGFASDIKMTYQSYPIGDGVGKGKAAQQLGDYVATINCKGVKVSTTFTIVKAPPTGTQPPTTTPTTAPPAKPKAPQVVVKPKGAPETGGGFLAG